MERSILLSRAIGRSTLIKWRRKPGESFRKGEPLYDLETDKTTMEVEAPCDGIMIEAKVAEGGSVDVGQVVCAIDEVCKPCNIR